jgi:D-xylose reductase
VSKLWNHFHHKDNVRSAFEVTLENFGLDYIDLYLIHYPLATDHADPRSSFLFLNNENKLILEHAPMHETWKELEILVDEGLIRDRVL